MEWNASSTGNGARCVRVVHDTGDVRKFPGIDTIEGWASPLLFGETMFAQSVEMPAGLFVSEHPEPVESIVYTVQGRWILSVDGERHVMGPGSLHWLKEGACAGCAVPFDEPALVVNFMRIKGADQRTACSIVCTKDASVVAKNGS
jgi:quercetin dioxygenase-like cupin family protein